MKDKESQLEFSPRSPFSPSKKPKSPRKVHDLVKNVTEMSRGVTRNRTEKKGVSSPPPTDFSDI